MEELNLIIANNIALYRKHCKLTQIELAEKLNFSDKSISKWERGESLPDINVLMAMCRIFDININQLVSEHNKNEIIQKNQKPKKNKLVISMLSSGLVWLVATVLFVALNIFAPNLAGTQIVFAYALPIFFIVLIVFSAIYKKRLLKFIFISCLIWTVFLPFSLTFGNNLYYLFAICIPLQILCILWYFIKKTKIK